MEGGKQIWVTFACFVNAAIFFINAAQICSSNFTMDLCLKSTDYQNASTQIISKLWRLLWQPSFVGQSNVEHFLPLAFTYTVIAVTCTMCAS